MDGGQSCRSAPRARQARAAALTHRGDSLLPWVQLPEPTVLTAAAVLRPQPKCDQRYPVDLVRALTMSAAAEGKAGVGVGQLLKEFKAVHGYKGFVTQGVLPEMLRATCVLIHSCRRRAACNL